MWLDRNVVRHLAAAAAVLGAAACGASESEQADRACTPVEPSLTAEASAAALVGEYAVTMIATSAAQGETPDTVHGTLTLNRYASDQRALSVAGGAPDPNFEAALYGTTDLPLERLGAPALGALDSADPDRPGVFVVERVGEPKSIMLRFGAEANRRDAQRFDGGYMAFQVDAIQQDGFAGSWRTGIMTTEAQGYFCAVRR